MTMLTDVQKDALAAFTLINTTDSGEPMHSVTGFLFSGAGKYKYEVKLDYRDIWHKCVNDARHTAVLKAILPGVSLWLAPHAAARIALRTATERGTSGVTIAELGSIWTLVVPDPPSGFPLMVTGRAE